MKIYNNKQKGGETDLLEQLLRLPKKNLETRIGFIENEIGIRQKISDNALTSLLTYKSRINEQLKRIHYIDQGFKLRRDFISKIIQLESRVIDEMVSCFRDISTLKEKLIDSKEELESEIQKMKLLK